MGQIKNIKLHIVTDIKIPSSPIYVFKSKILTILSKWSGKTGLLGRQVTSNVLKI